MTAAPVSTRRGTLLGLLRSAAALDRGQSDPVVAARNALGVAIPLAVGALAGNAAIGLASTIGALQTAFADRPGPYRLRVLRMAGTAAAAALTSGLAVLCSGSEVASTILLVVLAGVAGLLLTTGPAGTQVGVAGTAAALVLGHQAQRPGVCVHVALLVLAGGAVQLALAVAGWPLGRNRPEREALAQVYRGLAALARRPPALSAGPPLAEPLTLARATLFGLGHDHGPGVEAYRVLLDEAERIRREVLVLGGYADRLRGSSAATADELQRWLGFVGGVLDGVGTALVRGDRFDDSLLVPMRTQADRVLGLFEQLAGGSTEGEPVATDVAAATARAAAARVASLRGQLRAVVETTGAGASEGASAAPAAPGAQSRSMGDRLAQVRADLTFAPAVRRHAVRLAVVVGGSDLAVRLSGVDHGYWIPLTVVVVLRPDFATTFQRAAMRVLGTVIGLLVATALVHFVPGGQWYAVALIALFFFGMRLAGPGNLGLGAVCLAALVVVLLSLAGVPAHRAVAERGVDTAIGGVLALVATLIGPVWERELLMHRLAALLSAYRDLAAAVADLRYDPVRLQRARAEARRARTEAQASVDRARADLNPDRYQIEVGDAVLAHSHRLVNALIPLEGLRPSLRAAGELPELVALMSGVDDALADAVGALGSGQAPRTHPELRRDQERLTEVLTRGEGRGGDPATAAALIEASDRLVNALDTVLSELRRQLPRTAASVPPGRSTRP